MRNRESLLLEMDQLLNLLFESRQQNGDWNWSNAPFSKAIQSFCFEATAVIPTKELRRHVVEVWMRKRRLDAHDRRSVLALLNASLPITN